MITYDKPLLSSITLDSYDEEIHMYTYSFWSLSKSIEFRSKDKIQRGDTVKILDNSTANIIYFEKVDDVESANSCIVAVSTPIPVDYLSDYEWASNSHNLLVLREFNSVLGDNKTYLLVLIAPLRQDSTITGSCSVTGNKLEFSVSPKLLDSELSKDYGSRKYS